MLEIFNNLTQTDFFNFIIKTNHFVFYAGCVITIFLIMQNIITRYLLDKIFNRYNVDAD